MLIDHTARERSHKGMFFELYLRTARLNGKVVTLAAQHDFGAPVGLEVAIRAPDRVSGLIIQNANAHRSGFGPQWADTTGAS